MAEQELNFYDDIVDAEFDFMTYTPPLDLENIKEIEQVC